ncbi:hypothetical protein NM688_g3667 [Phlebia brevispora]|uniref:Uncharacterized protein n=1 Tax=Phlebia brevispora TaxID=194682 RepID=A0ACC1T5D0_9APHY|nr:hypothetical protein NM688_g3667 [Phlebia brevispora]
MSDSEGDFSDELLELAGAGEKKRRKRQAHKSAKRRKHEAPDLQSESESEGDGPESEEEDSNPYPLEGKYIDEEDRERLLGMSEIEREDILAQRQEEMQRIQDKRNLDQMLRERTGGGEESVSKAAKRQHAQRGATREKSRKLDELKARRKAKDDKKRTRTDSPKRDRSSSPMDMGSSDDEEEDGQISKFEEEDEQDRRHKTSADDEPTTADDLDMVRVSRDMIVKYCFAPWFGEFIKGAWVRYLVGQDGSTPVYRACEVVEVSTDVQHPYKVNDQLVDYELTLKHGSSEKKFPMDRISNTPFTDREFDRLVRVGELEKVKLPSRSALKKKHAQMLKFTDSPLTESDISAIVLRKNQVHAKIRRGGPAGAQLMVEKTRLLNARAMAVSRNDTAEIEQIDAQLAQLLGDSESRTPRREEPASDVIAKVNERNRKANLEAIRKAEQFEADRKRRERKLAASANGTATPPAERLRSKALDSRPGTPGTPLLKTALATPRSISPLPPPKSDKSKPADPDASFEEAVLDSVELDLGDF